MQDWKLKDRIRTYLKTKMVALSGVYSGVQYRVIKENHPNSVTLPIICRRAHTDYMNVVAGHNIRKLKRRMDFLSETRIKSYA